MKAFLNESTEITCNQIHSRNKFIQLATTLDLREQIVLNWNYDCNFNSAKFNLP